MSRLICWISCASILLFMASAFAQSIADFPVRTVEKPDLVLAKNIGGEIAWVDNENLLVTAAINGPGSEWWIRRVVSVDVRSGEAKELMSRGFVSCSNPAAGIVGVGNGTLAGRYQGGSKEPEPTPHLYQKSALLSSALVQFGNEDDWNKWLCIKTSKPDLTNPTAGDSQTDYRYLQTPGDTLRLVISFDKQTKDTRRSVVLYRGNKELPLSDLTLNELTLRPPFLPFLNKHLLAAGRVLIESTMLTPDGRNLQETPTITMTMDGKVEREYVRERLMRKGLKRDAVVTPYAKGNLIFVSNRPDYGGGIYRETADRFERIWCVNKGNGFSRMCRPQSISLSPDGCLLAFFDEDSDNSHKISPDISLKVLDVCH